MMITKERIIDCYDYGARFYDPLTCDYFSLIMVTSDDK